MSRSLSAEERALWHRVTADMRHDRRIAAAVAAKPVPVTAINVKPPVPPVVVGKPVPAARATLDARWDRQLGTGTIVPDRYIDLHGCTADAAHRRAVAAIGEAAAAGDRVVVLVTGKPPRAGTSRLDAPLRGIIRASIHDWLAASPVARRIAAIRPAHPRHGGSGALYVILRRPDRG